MAYTDYGYKFATVLDPKFPTAQLFNALGHITAGMAAGFDSAELKLLHYAFGNNSVKPSKISLYPFIILKAKNGNQLKTLHQRLKDTSLAHNAFTESMLGASAMEQLEKTSDINLQDMVYLAVSLFGPTVEVDTLTRKFSLFK